ncbi:MAG: hypothetical protein U0325_11200 [Polyangiales bacterium]
MALRSLLAGFAALSLAVTPASGWAQPSRSVMTTIAREHFTLGTHYFEVARYTDALREFQAAYDITHLPELLYNIALSQEGAGQLQAAVDTLQRFDDAGAPGSQRDLIRVRLANLRERLQTQAAPPAPTTPAQTAPAAPPATDTSRPTAAVAPTPPAQRFEVEYRRSALSTYGPWITLGVGGALTVLGIVSGSLAAGDVAALQTVNSGDHPWDASLHDRASSEIGGAYLFGVLGGTMVVGGALWLLLRGPGTRVETPIHAAVAPGPSGGVALAVGGAL